jgi:hypothetical protein
VLEGEGVELGLGLLDRLPLPLDGDDTGLPLGEQLQLHGSSGLGLDNGELLIPELGDGEFELLGLGNNDGEVSLLNGEGELAVEEGELVNGDGEG